MRGVDAGDRSSLERASCVRLPANGARQNAGPLLPENVDELRCIEHKHEFHLLPNSRVGHFCCGSIVLY